MNPKFSLLSALAIAIVASTAPAQDVVRPTPADPPTRPIPPVVPPVPPAPPPATRGLPDALKPFDTNEDGRLSREEYKAYIDHQRPEAPKSPWDTDGDGKLSPEEIAEARAEMRAKLEQRILARFHEADTDENGSLDLSEFLATLPDDVSRERAEAAFARLDTDGDGAIGTDEFLTFHGLPGRPDAPPPPRTRPENPKPKPPVVPPLPDHLKLIDSNGDGILSRSEILEAMENGLWPPRPKPPTDDEEEDDVADDGDTETPADTDTEV